MTPGWSMISAQTRFSRLSRGKTGRFSRRNHARIRGLGRDGFSKKSHTALETRTRKQPRMETVRLLRACVVALAFLAAAVCARPALAQANFDRPGGDYLSAPVISGDPAECALVCERDRRCRAWTFSYPTDLVKGAVCWLKSNVPARVQIGRASCRERGEVAGGGVGG